MGVGLRRREEHARRRRARERLHHHDVAAVLSAQPATGKPEITWFKAISGRDSFYVVQKAFKFEPAPEQAKQWVGWLDKVSVCDTRLPDRACPRGMR